MISKQIQRVVIYFRNQNMNTWKENTTLDVHSFQLLELMKFETCFPKHEKLFLNKIKEIFKSILIILTIESLKGSISDF